MTEATTDDRRSVPRDEETKPAQAGKGLEHLRVSSGKILIIDQFMLGNEQFLLKLKGIDSREAGGEETEILAEQYGGCVLSLAPGMYRVFRDPLESIIVLSRGGESTEDKVDTEQHAAGEPTFDFSSVLNVKGRCESLQHVFVDTRCLVFLDLSLLFNSELIDEYKNLRQKGRDKEARDLLRNKGGAVRYGFNKYGDELGVFQMPEPDTFALWPDVIE